MNIEVRVTGDVTEHVTELISKLEFGDVTE